MSAAAAPMGCAVGDIAFEDALDRVLRLVGEPLAAEDVSLAECIGRVTAAPLLARLDLPGFDQSAMDGYAVRVADLVSGIAVPVTGRTAAGEAPGGLAPGGAHRILTGAPLPFGADAVIAQENVLRAGAMVRIECVPHIGVNVRRRAEDIRVGDVLIPAGVTLDWRHMTVLAAQGVGAIHVRRRPRIVLLSSGRELSAIGETLAPGQIHDSNLPMLSALLTAWGATVRPMRAVADDAASMRHALTFAAKNSDLVLTTAGISVGDEDHVRDAVRVLGGDLTVLKVAMKPGKPLAAGRLGNTIFIGLPGNPIAALAGACGFVRPLLARMSGAPAPRILQALAAFDLQRKVGRAEFIPIRLSTENACIRAFRSGPDGSGRLAPLLISDGLAFVSAARGDIRVGDMIDIVSFVPTP